MDSGNSGSMQSSSGGGDEEYDSRAEPFSTFLNSSAQISSPMLSPPLPSSHHHHHQSSLFDPLANYFDAFPRSPPPPSSLNSLSNLDMGWPRGPRSDSSSTNIAGGFVAPSSSSTPPSLGAGLMTSNRIPYNPLNPSSVSLPSENNANNGCASAAIDQPNPTRNPKKRSRASRRAPTTVLTTDTSNFRAMVQEFTGIPAPPFSASSFPRSRLDLFTPPSAMRLSLSDPNPPYLLRPFVHKGPPHHPSFPSYPLGSSSSSPLTSSSSTVPDLVASTTTATNSTGAFGNSGGGSTSVAAASNAIPTNNYQLLSDLGLSKQNQSLHSMNNPIFTFPSPPKYQLANLAAFGSKSVGSTSQFQPSLNADPQLRMGTLDAFSMSHGLVSSQQGSLSSFIASEGMPSRGADPTPRWGADGAGPSNGHEEQLRPFNANHGGPQQQRVSSCKLNYNASSTSDFNAEKGPDNVQPRGEGMVDSWICSSD